MKPGMLDIALDSFAEAHPGQDMKLSIDGKKLAMGSLNWVEKTICQDLSAHLLLSNVEIHTRTN